MTKKETQEWLKNESKNGNIFVDSYLSLLENALPPVKDFWTDRLTDILNNNEKVGEK